MNKKTLKIAGWALGLSMAVAGIGATLGTLYISGKEAMEVSATDYSESVSILNNVDLLSSKSSSTGWTYTTATKYCGSETAAGKSGSIDIAYSTQSNINDLDWSSIVANKLTVTIVGGHNEGTGGITVNVKKDAETLRTETESSAYGKNTAASNNSSSHAYVFENVGQFNKIQITAGAKYYLRTITATFEYNEGVAATYTLTYAAGTNGTYDGTTQKEFTVRENAYETIKTPAAVGMIPNTGYVFDNWSDGTNNNLAPGSSYSIGTSNHTLTAQWVAGVGLSYSPISDSGSGTGTMETSYVKSGQTQTVASSDFTAPSGMRFAHWNTAADDSGTSYNADDNIDGFASPLTLYAIWETAPKSFDLTYPSGSTVNADETNQAGLFEDGNGNSIDDKKWSVVGENNDANAMSFNTAGEIRMYSNRADGKVGNTLTIRSLDSAVYVVNVTFNIQSSYIETTREVKKIVGGVQSIITPTEGTTYEIGGEGFSINNAHKGGSSNLQIRIDDISIEWDYVATFKAALAFEETYVKKGVSYSDNSKTNNCKTWYQQAIDAYNDDKVIDAAARIWFASRDEFANARARLIQWASVNGETISFNPSTGALASSDAVGDISALNSDNPNLPLIVTIVSAGILATGGLFLIQRKRRDQE